MRTQNSRAVWLVAGLAAVGFAGFLAAKPAQAITFYQHRLAFDYDALAYDSNPGDYTWDGDDWAQSADEIPGNKGTADKGPEVSIMVNDAAHSLKNVPFTVGPTTDGFNNAMLLYGQTVPVVPGKYLAVAVLYDQDCGPANHPVTANYTDGSVTQVITFQDWCFKQTPTDFYAWKVDHAEKKSGIDMGTKCGVDYKYIPLDANRTLQSITMGADTKVHAPGDKGSSGEEVVLFAMTLMSNDAGLPAYGTITGTVTDMGGGADGLADVFIPELRLKARGDQNKGTYSINVPAGTYHLAAIKEGDPSPDVAPVTVTVAAGQTVTQPIVLGAPDTTDYAEVKGTVVDQTMKPVSGSTVTVLSAQNTAIQTTATDASGAFDVKGLLPGSVKVTADLPLAGAASSNTVTLAGGMGTTLPITLNVLPSLDLSSANLPKGTTWDLQSGNTGAMIDPTNFGPADPAFKEDMTWMKGEMVPGELSMDVGGAGWFWLRLSGVTLPAAMQAFQGKNVPLVLKGYEIGGNPAIDRNARDITFFNGHQIGSQSNFGNYNEPATVRTYAVDPSFVNWTGSNTIAMLIYTGGTPAGITASGPVLLPLRSDQALIGGTLTDTGTGKPSTQTTAVALSLPGATAPFLTTQGVGSYSFLGVQPGSYVVSVPVSATVSQGSTMNIMAAGGANARADLTVQFPPFIESTTADPHDDPFTGMALDTMKWTDEDIGMPGAAGKALLTMGHLEQDGDGGGFAAAGDNLNFLHQKISGDFAATVQVLSAPSNGNNSAAGLMVRDGTVPNDAAIAAVAGMYSMNSAVATPFRLASASDSNGVDGVTAATTPVWVKIRKVGSEVATYWSTDGKTPHLMSVEETEILSDALIGTLVTSAMDGTLGTGTFASFKVVPLTSGPPPTGPVCGDLLGKGAVSVSDATIALRIAVGLVTATATNTTGACGHTINVAFATQVLHAAVFGGAIAPKTM